MTRQTSSVMIGAFVVGAVLLAVAAVVVLSGGRFWSRATSYVAYFDGSLDGLDVGAPVTFNGVRIGSVAAIRVVIEADGTSIHTPVVFDIDARRLHDVRGGPTSFDRAPARLDDLIRRGLRARLELQSLVTGQRAVALNFYPDTPIRLVGSKHHPEIPTVPSSFDTLARTLQTLPIETLATETIRAMRSVDTLARAPEVRAALVKLDRLLGDADGLVRTVNGRVDPLAASVEQAAVQARSTMIDAQAAIARLEPAVGATLADYQRLAQDARTSVAHADVEITAVSATLQKALVDAQAALGVARSVLGEDSPVREDLTDALREITKAARTLRALAESLDRHPEAVLSGKRAEPNP